MKIQTGSSSYIECDREENAASRAKKKRINKKNARKKKQRMCA
jgi:hypothetical protein